MLAAMIAGVGLASGEGDALLLALVGGCGAAVALAGRLGRRLPARIDLPAAGAVA